MDLIKEIAKYQKLREDLENLGLDGEYTIYKATARGTDKVYYGYAKGTSDEDIHRAFFSPQNRIDDPSRGTLRMIDAAGGSEEIEFDPLDMVNGEETALISRNEEREKDPHSIVPPSFFPAHIYKQAKEKHPEYFAQREKQKFDAQRQAREQKELNKFKNAREAAHLFDPTELKGLRQKHGQQAVNDYSTMLPVPFQKKYGVSMKMPEIKS